MSVSAIGLSKGRDLRLDFFRGLANWAIFLDHIPNNAVAWLTSRNYGFSDAADLFVFISGYTAAFVYARRMAMQGILAGTALLLRRVWQLYVAHILLFVFYLAAVHYLAHSFNVPHLMDEFNVARLMDQPVELLTQGLVLQFKPLNMDVLPLYIVLMAGFAPLLWLMMRLPNLSLAASIAVYLLARHLNWNFPAYPSGVWYFNPFTWQLLFAIGAWAALGGAAHLHALLRSRTVLIASSGFIAFSLVVTLSDRFDELAAMLPTQLLEPFIPNDKTNLAAYRVLHLLALVVVVIHVMPEGWSGLRSRITRPIIVCGQRSLEVFCVGIFLSFVAHFILETFSGDIITQIAVSGVGIVLMTGVALYRTWLLSLDKLVVAKSASGTVPVHHN
ncbi:MAG: OpgC domain-containing protein [Afipia sp.]|nr:OpgC domain-containing protein [Afipia sp.]